MSSETYPRAEGRKRPLKGKSVIKPITGKGLHINDRSKIIVPPKKEGASRKSSKTIKK